MSLKDDLQNEVSSIIATRWKTRKGQKVPEAEDVQLGNDAVELDGTVLYADLAESTALVDANKASFAAEIYKAYLVCACRIISQNDGSITAFDGDRVMAVFVGDSKNTSAARCSLQINYAVKSIIIPTVRRIYNSTHPHFSISHAVGIDTGTLFIAKTGIRGSNDLVWVGTAANWSAKLSAIRSEGFSSWITQAVFEQLSNSSKFTKNGQLMWEQRQWKGRTIYGSTFWWEP